MITKNTPPIELLPKTGINYIIEFYYEFNQIKQLLRQGWLKRGLPEEKCESVGDHILGVYFLALIINKEYNLGMDDYKLALLSPIHDLPEAIEGDPTPHDGIPENEKIRRETEAMRRLFRNFHSPEKYLALWDEYARQSTPEARFVRQVVKLEMALLASIYEKQYGKDLSDFFVDVRSKLQEPALKSILEEIITLRGR